MSKQLSFHLDHLKLRRDYRANMPVFVSRFIGYRPPEEDTPPYQPLPFPPFSWLVFLPMRLEVWISAWIGCFGGILLIEAIMSTSTVFRDVYGAPIIVTSFGASAVLLFAAIESPLAQPRNFILGGPFCICFNRHGDHEALGDEPTVSRIPR